MARLVFLSFFYPVVSFSSITYAGAAPSRQFGIAKRSPSIPLFYASSALPPLDHSHLQSPVFNIRGGTDTVEAVDETETQVEDTAAATTTTAAVDTEEEKEAPVETLEEAEVSSPETATEEVETAEPVAEIAETASEEPVAEEITMPIEEKKPSSLSNAFAPVVSTMKNFGKVYGKSLETRPILTKSVTACFIFALSDFLAQRLDNPKEEDEGKKPINWVRTMSCALVGLLYFGPAAHYWYEMIFRLLPGTSLVSTMQKAALGQLIFGPSFTCIFFAASLLQSGTFSMGSWVRKIRDDLPTAWAAGLGFWPLVDLVSYSLIQPQWIPLFVNTCSLVWTVYLSWIANRKQTE